MLPDMNFDMIPIPPPVMICCEAYHIALATVATVRNRTTMCERPEVVVVVVAFELDILPRCMLAV